MRTLVLSLLCSFALFQSVAAQSSTVSGEQQASFAFDGSVHTVTVSGLIPNQYVAGTNVNFGYQFTSSRNEPPAGIPWSLRFGGRSVSINGEVLSLDPFGPESPPPSGGVRFASNRFPHGSIATIAASVTVYFVRTNAEGQEERTPNTTLTATVPVRVYNRLAAFDVGFPNEVFNGAELNSKSLDVIKSGFANMKYDTSLSQSLPGSFSKQMLVNGLRNCTAFYVNSHGDASKTSSTYGSTYWFSLQHKTGHATYTEEDYFTTDEVNAALGQRVPNSANFLPRVQFAFHDTCHSGATAWALTYWIQSGSQASGQGDTVNRSYLGWSSRILVRYARTHATTLMSRLGEGYPVARARSLAVMALYDAGLVLPDAGSNAPQQSFGGDARATYQNVYLADSINPSEEWYLVQ